MSSKEAQLIQKLRRAEERLQGKQLVLLSKLDGGFHYLTFLFLSVSNFLARSLFLFFGTNTYYKIWSTQTSVSHSVVVLVVLLFQFFVSLTLQRLTNILLLSCIRIYIIAIEMLFCVFLFRKWTLPTQFCFRNN